MSEAIRVVIIDDDALYTTELAELLTYQGIEVS